MIVKTGTFKPEELVSVSKKLYPDYTIVVNDLVFLNSGSPAMRVVGVKESGDMVCDFFGSTDTVQFPRACLTRIEQGERNDGFYSLILN